MSEVKKTGNIKHVADVGKNPVYLNPRHAKILQIWIDEVNAGTYPIEDLEKWKHLDELEEYIELLDPTRAAKQRRIGFILGVVVMALGYWATVLINLP